MVVLFLLQLLFVFLVLLNMAVHQLRLYLNLFNAMWVRPVLVMNHGALLLSGHEVKLFFFAIDIEVDFSGSNINLSSYSAQEGSPKDEGRFFCNLHVEHHEVDRDVAIPDFHRNIFRYPCWVADHRIGQLKHHWCWHQLHDV